MFHKPLKDKSKKIWEEKHNKNGCLGYVHIQLYKENGGRKMYSWELLEVPTPISKPNNFTRKTIKTWGISCIGVQSLCENKGKNEF